MRVSHLLSVGHIAASVTGTTRRAPLACPRLAACAVGLTALLAGAPSALGQIIYSTGFEAPAFVAGLPLAAQDGWIAPVPFLSPAAAVVTSDKPRQGQQTVRVRGADLEHSDLINQSTGGFYDAIGSYRRPVNFDTAGAQVSVSANVRIDGPQNAAGNHFFSASVAAIATLTDGSAAEVGEFAICSDGNVYGYTGNDAVPTFLTSAPVTLGEWHNLAVVADFTARTSSFYVDGESVGTIPFDPNPGDPGVGYTNILRRGSMLTYAAPDTATLHKADYSAHFDRFSIRVVDDDDDGGEDR